MVYGVGGLDNSKTLKKLHFVCFEYMFKTCLPKFVKHFTAYLTF